MKLRACYWATHSAALPFSEPPTTSPSAVAVATIGSPATPVHIDRMFNDARDELESRGEAQVLLGGRTFRVKRAFVDDLEKHPMPEHIAALRKALLIMHAPLDDTVEIDNASALFQAAKHPKSFVSLDDADHLLTREADSRYAGQVLAAWAARYLPMTRDDEEAPADKDAGDVVATTRTGGFRTTMNVAGHPMVADEPRSYGGTETGPTPYDLLAAALASCTSMTLRMYAERKKLKFRAATVRVRHQKIHAADCADCVAEDGKVDSFERVISLEGEFTEAEADRMLEIADRCPVHRTLEGEVQVLTVAAD